MAVAASPAADAGALPLTLLVALLVVPGAVVVMLCLDFWRLCRRDRDGRDSSASGRHSVLVGNSSFVWKRGPSKKKPKLFYGQTNINGLDSPTGVEGTVGGGDGVSQGSTADASASPLPPAPAVPDIAAELPYLLPADAAAASPRPSPPSTMTPAATPSMGNHDDGYQCPGGDGDMPYRSPADELKRTVAAEEEPYYAVPVHRAAEPAPLPPPRRRQART